MADSWLIMAVRVKDRAALDLKNKITQGTIVGGDGGKLHKRFINFAEDLLNGLLGGTKRGNIVATILDTSATFSTGNIACVQANAAGDTITWTYGGKTVVLTEGATGESGFARGASNTTCATNLAACINAHSVLGPLFTALGSVGNCGLTANIPTALLQDFALTTSDGTAFSFTQMTSGNEGAAQFIPVHFSTGFDL